MGRKYSEVDLGDILGPRPSSTAVKRPRSLIGTPVSVTARLVVKPHLGLRFTFMTLTGALGVEEEDVIPLSGANTIPFTIYYPSLEQYRAYARAFDFGSEVTHEGRLLYTRQKGGIYVPRMRTIYNPFEGRFKGDGRS